MKEGCVSFSCGVKKPPNHRPPIVTLYIKKFFCHLDDQISHMCISSQNVKLNFQKCCNNTVKHAFISPDLQSDWTDFSLQSAEPSELTGCISPAGRRKYLANNNGQTKLDDILVSKEQNLAFEF